MVQFTFSLAHQKIQTPSKVSVFFILRKNFFDNFCECFLFCQLDGTWTKFYVAKRSSIKEKIAKQFPVGQTVRWTVCRVWSHRRKSHPSHHVEARPKVLLFVLSKSKDLPACISFFAKISSTIFASILK